MPPTPAAAEITRIAREVQIGAPPVDVAAALESSHWAAALEVLPEGSGARVRMAATAGPAAVADALEQAILEAVCAVKRRLEDGADG